jgi:hypothetical protein
VGKRRISKGRGLNVESFESVKPITGSKRRVTPHNTAEQGLNRAR